VIFTESHKNGECKCEIVAATSLQILNFLADLTSKFIFTCFN